jgi:hypothetical protein
MTKISGLKKNILENQYLQTAIFRPITIKTANRRFPQIWRIHLN